MPVSEVTVREKFGDRASCILQHCHTSKHPGIHVHGLGGRHLWAPHFIEPSIAAAQGHRGLNVYRAVLCSAMRFEFPPSQLLVRIFSRVMIDSTARAAPGPSVPNFAGCTTTDRLRHASPSFHGAEEEKRGISAQQWMMRQQCKTSETVEDLEQTVA